MDKYSTLDTVCRQLSHDMGREDERLYNLFLGYGYNFFNGGEYPAGAGGGTTTLKTVLLQVNADRMADLPDDYVEFVSVGRVIGNHVRNLSYNAALVPDGLTTPPEPGVIGYGDLSHPVTFAPAYAYWNWESLGLTGWDGYGYGWGEFRDEFAIDRAEGTIRVSSQIEPFGQPLVFQYQSNDNAPGKPTPVHPYWHQALKAWMLWHWYSKAKENFQSANYHKAEYLRERKAAIRRTDPTSYADVTALIYQNYNRIR